MDKKMDEMNGDSLEARETLLTLSVLIQCQFWRQFRFKFQVGWIAAGLLDRNDFALAIQKARQVINEEGCEVAEEFFTELWEQYIQGLADGDFCDWRKWKGDEE